MATVHHIVPDDNGKVERLPDGALVVGTFVIRVKNGELNIGVVEQIKEQGADEWVRVGKIVLSRTRTGVDVKLDSGVVVKVTMP